MIIYPAIDLKGGKCVRLKQGLKNEETVYDNDPASVAIKWQNQGAKYLHVIDLDGAFEGKPLNVSTIEHILLDVVIPIQVGGGIRDGKTMEEYFSMGVSRLIIGTKAIESPEFLEEIVKEFKERIIIGIDAKDGYASTHGWVSASNIKATDLALDVQKMGAYQIIYTDISRDGMLKGPNYQAMEEMVNAVDMPVIASGGISSKEDVKKLSLLEGKGLVGAIIGKALYTGDIQLQDII